VNENYFADYYSEGADIRVGTFWNLDYGLPVPRKMPSCPVCGGRMIIKDWRHHQRDKTSSPYRIDVGSKCVDCSAVIVFGVRVDAKTFNSKRTQRGYTDWRTGKAILAGQGFFDEV